MIFKVLVILTIILMSVSTISYIIGFKIGDQMGLNKASLGLIQFAKKIYIPTFFLNLGLLLYILLCRSSLMKDYNWISLAITIILFFCLFHISNKKHIFSWKDNSNIFLEFLIFAHVSSCFMSCASFLLNK